jgi:N-ethylmaleimide reductase
MPATSTATADLFTPIQLGAVALPNRIVLAPLTRNRAGAGNVPQTLNASYYEQRATAGLIITETSQIRLYGLSRLIDGSCYFTDSP